MENFRAVKMVMRHGQTTCDTAKLVKIHERMGNVSLMIGFCFPDDQSVQELLVYSQIDEIFERNLECRINGNIFEKLMKIN